MTMKKVLDGLKYSFHILSHPIQGFYDMRFEKQGNLVSCIILLALMTAALIAQQLYTGLAFHLVNIREFNVFRQIAGVIVPVLLWTVANWSITVLMDGEGRFVDIFMATCYATMPYTATVFLYVLLSRLLTADESAFLGLVMNIGLVIAALLLFSGMVTVHQFTVFKAILSLILTVAAMVFIAFLSILFLSCIDQLINYIKGIIVELKLRV